MLDIFKIIWDLFVIRDATRKGQMGWRVWAIAIGFVIFLYGTGVPVSLLYEDHPQYKALFIAVLSLDVLAFVAVMVWGIRRYVRQSRQGRA